MWDMGHLPVSALIGEQRATGKRGMGIWPRDGETMTPVGNTGWRKTGGVCRDWDS
ncbi:hypothetical protein GCM10007928_39950 [Sulfitobacter porphyrae]|nr:hypothetical protein GCM10007928_39950 [Sulfitobacter porphyrae]